MTNVKVTLLSDVLGARIEGVDIARISDAEFADIERALHEHLVVVIPRQSLEPAAFAAFARRFGKAEPHVIDQFHHKADPNILILSNRRNDKGEPIGLADGGTYFHCDYSYLDVPARCTILYALEIPGSDAGTTFANQRRAYETLPADERAKLDGLVCRHHYGNRDNLDEESRTAASRLSGEQKARMSWVRHPLVRKHPHGPWKSIYAVSGSSFGVEGMDDAAGVALLNRLKQHSTAARYCYTPTYAPGDVVIWDNVSLLHSAPLIDQARPRTLWRITVKEAGPTI
ncbi:MAG TPA: TauD/TfdA family dioxygenase [Hyphomicrobiaceae bacterium]|nr:TauD/TfdA family dioxygenase [Hyphomicrobiaceae bacterium]